MSRVGAEAGPPPQHRRGGFGTLSGSRGERTAMSGFGDNDDYAGAVPDRLPIATLRELSRVDGWRGLLHVALEWAGIAGAIWVCARHFHPALYLLAVAWIGARQHALAILMHDATHFRLHPSRRVNEVVSELLLAWPLFITVRGYRVNHFAHHRKPNTDEDPDWVRKRRAPDEWRFPMRWPQLAALLLKDLCGWNSKRLLTDLATFSGGGSGFAQARPGPARWYLAARLGLYAAAALAFTLFELWTGFLVYWAVPLLTWLVLVLRVRSIAEHFAIERDHVYTTARTTLPTPLERLFVAPKNVGYHLEHHLCPSVPFYNLPRLHAEMMALDRYANRAHLTEGYTGVLRECVTGARTGGRT